MLWIVVKKTCTQNRMHNHYDQRILANLRDVFNCFLTVTNATLFQKKHPVSKPALLIFIRKNWTL